MARDVLTPTDRTRTYTRVSLVIDPRTLSPALYLGAIPLPFRSTVGVLILLRCAIEVTNPCERVAWGALITFALPLTLRIVESHLPQAWLDLQVGVIDQKRCAGIEVMHSFRCRIRV